MGCSMPIKAEVLRLLKRSSLIAAILMIVMIFLLGDSSLATSTFSLAHPFDKGLHAFVYGTIAALMRFSGAFGKVLTLWLLLVCVGAADELHQLSIPGREGSFLDLIADVVGITFGMFLIGRLQHRVQLKSEGNCPANTN